MLKLRGIRSCPDVEQTRPKNPQLTIRIYLLAYLKSSPFVFYLLLQRTTFLVQDNIWFVKHTMLPGVTWRGLVFLEGKIALVAGWQEDL